MDGRNMRITGQNRVYKHHSGKLVDSSGLGWQGARPGHVMVIVLATSGHTLTYP